jgi:hypothetical protein
VKIDVTKNISITSARDLAIKKVKGRVGQQVKTAQVAK